VGVRGRAPAFFLGRAHSFLRYCGGTVIPIHRCRIDRTWIRRHDLRETILNLAHRTARRMPTPVENAVRRLSKSAIHRGL
jgi:hypothetical protein